VILVFLPGGGAWRALDRQKGFADDFGASKGFFHGRVSLSRGIEAFYVVLDNSESRRVPYIRFRTCTSGRGESRIAPAQERKFARGVGKVSRFLFPECRCPVVTGSGNGRRKNSFSNLF
jgi:hypothetical protein